LAALLVPEADGIDWNVAVDLSSGQPIRLPLDLCLRRPADQRDIDVPWPLSIGCAAGEDAISATVSALLELIERHAVTAWWHEGQPGRAIAPESTEAAAGSVLLRQLRGDRTGRMTWLIDITPEDPGVPAFAATAALRLNPPPRPAAGLTPRPAAGLTTADPAGALLWLRQRLAACGLTPYAPDLTRPEFAIPVVRVVCPGLRIAAPLAQQDRAPAPLF
jgi:ribosomal protein S12 methylthiotransferase accessory factor YcaO